MSSPPAVMSGTLHDINQMRLPKGELVIYTVEAFDRDL